MKQTFKEQDRLKRLRLGNVIKPLPNPDDRDDRQHFATYLGKIQCPHSTCGCAMSFVTNFLENGGYTFCLRCSAGHSLTLWIGNNQNAWEPDDALIEFVATAYPTNEDAAKAIRHPAFLKFVKPEDLTSISDTYIIGDAMQHLEHPLTVTRSQLKELITTVQGAMQAAGIPVERSEMHLELFEFLSKRGYRCEDNDPGCSGRLSPSSPPLLFTSLMAHQ